MSIQAYFSDKQCDLPGLAKYLDNLPQAQRIKEATSFNSKQQQALWTASEGGERLKIEDFVPSSKETHSEVIHWGRNSLPVFKLFQKRMCKVAEGNEPSGYNEQAIKAITGNGYFVCRETNSDDADDHGVVIDYTQTPSEKAGDWPPLAPCKERLGRFIYDGNYDYMRKVSQHVTIGRAKKANSEKWMPNWFVLCRED